MKLSIAATLLAIHGASAQLSKRRLRAQKDLAEDDAALVKARVLQFDSMSMIKGAGMSAGGSSKSGKSTTRSLTGIYDGYDIEDATPQTLELLCDDRKYCNVILTDYRFSTCEQELGTSTLNTGVGIATGVPVDSLDDFKIGLYCLKAGEIEIDFDDGPTTYLTGNIALLRGGGIRRTGPGFSYSKVCVPTIKDTVDKSISINDKSVNLNGRYRGIDKEDGSRQTLELLCTLVSCDVTLADFSFSTCKELNPGLFFTGVALAKNVPRDSLDDFEIELFCLPPGQLVIGPSQPADGTLKGNLAFLRDGLLRRTGTGFTYFKDGPEDAVEAFSVYKDITTKFFGMDIEDGSFQALELDCNEGICDISLQDTSFSTCIENISAGRYLGGLALAKNVPQDSLSHFTLELFCAPVPVQGIDYGLPLANLTGNLAVLQDGIVRRTGPGFNYYDVAKQRKALDGYYYAGIVPADGGFQQMKVLCEDGSCEVILHTQVERDGFGTCITGPPPASRFTFSSIYINRTVPENSLENFDIGLYCVPVGAGGEIDYDTQDPAKTIKAKIVQGEGAARVTKDGVVYEVFRLSDGS